MAGTLWTRLDVEQLKSLSEQNLNARDYFLVIAEGQTMTDNAVRAAMILIDNIGEFEVYTDTLALQQLGELPALSMNSGTILHVAGNHYITVTHTNPMFIDIFDSLNSRTVSSDAKPLLGQLKPNNATGVLLRHVSQQLEVECGIRSVCNLTLVALGLNPTEYDIYGSQCRPHLARCLINQKMTLFPAKKIKCNIDPIMINI